MRRLAIALVLTLGAPALADVPLAQVPFECRMGYVALQNFLKDRHDAICDAYDLSPETRWCLTNQESLWRQADETQAACKAKDQEAAVHAVDRAARKRCNVRLH